MSPILVVIAPGFHLFPFRTEKLSPVTPMVLHTRGRVGSRQLISKTPSRAIRRESFWVYTRVPPSVAFLQHPSFGLPDTEK